MSTRVFSSYSIIDLHLTKPLLKQMSSVFLCLAVPSSPSLPLRDKKHLYCLLSPNMASTVVVDSIFIFILNKLLMKGFTRRKNEIFSYKIFHGMNIIM